MAKTKKVKYELPTPGFPHKIKWRLMMLGKPRKYLLQTDEGMPAFTEYGVRVSALRGLANDRITDLNYPYIRQLVRTKRRYKNFFPQQRVEYLDHYIELSNVTCYSKLANCVLDLKKNDVKDQKKKRAWSDSDWKKHMDYIGGIAGPKKAWEPDPVDRGPTKAVGEFDLGPLLAVPDHKLYRRISAESWYKDPTKVSPAAMKYVINDRVLKLATPKVYPNPDA